jgi:hypothetical protein
MLDQVNFAIEVQSRVLSGTIVTSVLLSAIEQPQTRLPITYRLVKPHEHSFRLLDFVVTQSSQLFCEAEMAFEASFALCIYLARSCGCGEGHGSEQDMKLTMR